jgi:hypothetical protein
VAESTACYAPRKERMVIIPPPSAAGNENRDVGELVICPDFVACNLSGFGIAPGRVVGGEEWAGVSGSARAGPRYEGAAILLPPGGMAGFGDRCDSGEGQAEWLSFGWDLPRSSGFGAWVRRQSRRLQDVAVCGGVQPAISRSARRRLIAMHINGSWARLRSRPR